MPESDRCTHSRQTGKKVLGPLDAATSAGGTVAPDPEQVGHRDDGRIERPSDGDGADAIGAEDIRRGELEQPKTRRLLTVHTRGSWNRNPDRPAAAA
jgi:hypothetical protein